MTNKIICGDALEVLRGMPDRSVHCVVTSPPYWGLRDYGVEGQLGLEKTPEEYVERLVGIFREARRVLRDDGTLWLVLGDSYTSGGRGGGMEGERGAKQRSNQGALLGPKKAPSGLKPKDLVGTPWRVAFALQADGWWLRQDIIWAKPNPMPESVHDRPTKSHEHIFLLTKSQRYYYDQDAIREPFNYPDRTYNPDVSNHITAKLKEQGNRCTSGLHDGRTQYGDAARGRNKRDVWTVSTKPYKEAHFAVFPLDLIRPCILAGSSEKGCCPECGAPWRRIVERKMIKRSDIYGGSKFKERDKNFSHKRLQMMVKAGRAAGLPHDNPIPAKRIIGWRPTCNHYPQVNQWLEYPRQKKDESDEDYEKRCIPIRQERQRLLTLWEPMDGVPCIVLDPFFGSGTTAIVAKQEGRHYIGVELNPEYVEMARKRINRECPMERLL